uniref:SERPIN domain-containing protein n=1 Tax=Rhabditophanes sp. KR3021 TaxID=114890 RepID=A0AC35TZM8_9BILA
MDTNFAAVQANFTLNSLNTISPSNSEAFIFSPLSLIAALSMCYLGAGGRTAEQFKNVLNPNQDDSEYFSAIERSLIAMEKSQSNVTLISANKLFIQNGLDLNYTFLAGIDKYFHGHLQELNFSDNVKSVNTINNYISNVTHNKINKLLSPDSVGRGTRLVLANAIYFKGNWKYAFNENATQKAVFSSNTSNQRKVDMMYLSRKLLYSENFMFHMVKLVYNDDKTSMVLLVPKHKFGLSDGLRTYNSSMFSDMLGDMTEEDIRLSMPKFKTESTHDLEKLVKAFGITDAFSDKADFSGMSNKDGLMISKIVQKAFVEVNEKGTEAAVATAVLMVRMSMPMASKSPIIVKADHPFLYFILGADNGLLFNGLYA